MASASSPMREALAQLASHGLVQQSNRRGFRLPPLSAAHPVDVLLGKLADRRHRTSARSVTVRPKLMLAQETVRPQRRLAGCSASA
jgi:DNA-binding FadR family transcriptional regulator